MAFRSKNGGMKTLSFTFQNLKKEDDEAFIEVFDRSKGEKGEKIDECDFVSGKLVDIIFGEGHYENDKYFTCILVFVDEGVRYKVKCSFDKINILMRNILNRLLSATSFDDIKISYFGKKNEYKNAVVYSNNEKLEYYYSREEIDEKVDKITDKRGTVIKRDFHDLDVFLIDKIKDIVIPQLEGDPYKSKKTVTESSEETPSNDYQSPNESPDPGQPDNFIDDVPEDDIPF